MRFVLVMFTHTHIQYQKYGIAGKLYNERKKLINSLLFFKKFKFYSSKDYGKKILLKILSKRYPTNSVLLGRDEEFHFSEK